LGTRERITMPDDLSSLARRSEREFDVSDSEIRPIVPLHAVPWLMVTYDALREMPLDNRDAFVLSLVDGRSTVEIILDLAGLPEDVTIGILTRLFRLGAIDLRMRTG
jgi:hypothetical protein